LAALRAIPGMTLIRPADANETRAAWQVAMQHLDGPVGLVLTRQKVPTLEATRTAEAQRGAYVLVDHPAAQAILIATGSEVHVALAAHERLAALGIASRVVSMPSCELFRQQPESFRDQVLPPSIRARVAIEAGVSQGWERFIGEAGAFVGIERFGASAPAKDLFELYGLTPAHVVEVVSRMIRSEPKR
jgi:transketolase